MSKKVGAWRLCQVLLGVSLLAGCAVSPGNGRSVGVYDFGLPVVRSGGADAEWPRVALEVVSPPWFDLLNVDYRLAYDDPLKQREYSGSRWAGAPGLLLSQHLRQRLGMASATGNAAAECLLRFELQEFSQVFDSPTQSRGVLQGSASLIDARKQRIAGKRFSIEKPAASQDARGGVDALVARTGIDAASLQVELLELELAGHVARLPGGLYQRLGRA